MSKPSLILRRGSKQLDLNDQDQYWLAQDFIPPATLYATQFADGLSANRNSGGSLVGKRAQNQMLTFTVRLAGRSAGQIAAAERAIQAMLSYAGDKDAPLYLEYNPRSDVPEPLWGQFGSSVRYEVVDGRVSLGDGYLVGVRRAEDVNCVLQLTLKPYALGQAQRLCTAVGGILEDTIGTVDGRSRGLMVPAEATNNFINPVFGHATFGNDWTAGASLTATENTDPEYVLFGSTSAKLTSNSATNNSYTQALTLTVATYTLSFYAKQYSGAAVTAAVLYSLFDGDGEVVTIASVGNGWYRCTFSGTASAAATAYGVVVSAGYSVFVDGFQVEAGAYATPLVYGDLLGCAWAGTAHDSASTRTAASCKLPITADTFNNAQGSARFVVRFDVPNTHATSMYLFDTRDGGHTASLVAFFNEGDDKFYLYTTANAAVSAAKTFSAGTTYVLHFVWSAAGMVCYVNGAADGTDDYVYATPGASAFLGSDYGSGNSVNGSFLAGAFFDVPLTAAQVLADYNEIAPLAADGVRVESVPWLWTKDGDNAVDNCDDSTHENWCVAGGIAGSTEAITEFQITNSPDIGGHYLALVNYEYSELPFALQAGQFYTDLQGTARADASGGETEELGIAGYMPASVTEVPHASLFSGKTTHFILRALRAAGTASQKVYPTVRLNAGRDILGNGVTLALTTAYKMFYLGNINIQYPKFLSEDQMHLYFATYQVPGANAWDGDFLCAIPGRVLHYAHNVADTGTNTVSYIEGDTGMAIWSGALYQLTLMGDRIEFQPDQANQLIHFIGDGNGSGAIGDTATFVILVTPRWVLL